MRGRRLPSPSPEKTGINPTRTTGTGGQPNSG